jgi:hypothetical protein
MKKSEFIHNLLHHYYMTLEAIPTPALRIPNPVGARSSLGAAHRSPMNYTSNFWESENLRNLLFFWGSQFAPQIF